MKILLLNRRVLVVTALLLSISPSLTIAIDLSTAVSRTLAANPALQLYPYHVRALEGEALQAGLKPNPTLHVDLENAFGTGDSQFLTGPELTLSLSQVIELGHKRDNRVDVVDRKSLAIQREYEVKRLDVITSMLRDYYQILRFQHLISWNSQRIEAEQDALKVIERRANAGVVGKADVMRMQLRLAKSQAKQSQLKAQHANSLNILAANWTESANFSEVAGDLSQTPTAPDMAVLNQAIESTPDYLLSATQARIGEAQLALAKAESQANVTVGAGVRRLEDNDDNAFVFSFSMPLQWQDRNQGNIATAQAVYEESLFNQDLLKTHLEIALGRLHSAMLNNLHQLQLVDTNLRPVANSLLAEVKRGYQLGLYSVLQWVDAQDELFSIERDRIEAQHAVHLQYLELERLSGSNLDPQTAFKE
ncbi:TolC family protein [Methylophaga thiooxydans]|uniref:Outer membrane efflux protein n=1 Tax=Methylophaga thiooxydans DMS010 TaxID=637616 RepID=C0N445_9GAMM|nr:TolC family protein [Methylophaga thiooxydans]EEF80459.1 outer membrane efflux protein [Methylophaga thiooxydans DMS010]